MTGPDRLQAAREALRQAPRPDPSNFDLVAYMDWFFQVRGRALTEADREALALLQSGPDPSRESSETAERIVDDWVYNYGPLTTTKGGWPILPSLRNAIAAALDAAAEGQGDLLKAVALVVKNFRQDEKDGRRSRDRRYVLDMLERFVPLPVPPVSASKPEVA